MEGDNIPAGDGEERRGTAVGAAEMASSIFRRVSNDNPASIFAQAAAMALELKDPSSRFTATELYDALLADETLLSDTFAAAVRAHERANEERKKRGQPPIREISRSEFDGVLNSDFRIAAGIRDLPAAEIQNIIYFIYDFEDSDSITTRERAALDYTNSLLEARGLPKLSREAYQG